MTTLTLPGKTLHEKRNVLVNLSNRALSPEAETIVFDILYRLKPATDEYDAKGERIQKDAREVQKLPDGPEKIAAFKDLQARLDAREDHEHTVPAPKVKLTVAHLPKEKQSHDGNALGNAAIRYALTPDFFEAPKDE